MSSFKLAPVRWSLGQTLLPLHFEAQEQALEARMRLHASLSGRPGHGVAELRWDGDSLARGLLSISALTAVMPGSGRVVSVPGNAVLGAFSLEDIPAPEVTVYLHVLERATDAKEQPLYTEDPPELRRVLHVLRLSADPVVSEPVVDRMALATFRRDTKGQWHLSEQQVPPLLLVGPHPFLGGLLEQLDRLLEQTRLQLLSRLSDSYLRSDRLSDSRRALCQVHQLQALRDDMHRHVSPHPHDLFDALRQLYFTACCYLEQRPARTLPAYEHDAPGKGMAHWMELLTLMLRPEATRLTHRPFEARDGRFVFSPLPEELGEGDEVYLLVQRRHVAEPLSLDGVKLASPSRLAAVRRMALKGVPFHHVPHPSFPHALGPEIDWYQLTTGEEWQFAVREDGLAFYITPTLQDAQVSLFWRKA